MLYHMNLNRLQAISIEYTHMCVYTRTRIHPKHNPLMKSYGKVEPSYTAFILLLVRSRHHQYLMFLNKHKGSVNKGAYH